MTYCQTREPYLYLPVRERVRLNERLSIKPLNYSLSLFELEFGGSWGYNGIVKIESSVSKSTDEVVINTKELDITAATILSKDGKRMFTSTTVAAWSTTSLSNQLLTWGCS